MLTINFINKTSTSIDKSSLKKVVEKVLKKHGYDNNVEVSVALVSHLEVVDLAMKYMKESRLEAEDHPVLSFLRSETEDKFIDPPDNINHLGEIVISLEKSIEKAKQDKKSLQEVVNYWADHATLHLCGIHHD